MNSPNNLEINGDLTTYPLAELLAEILQSGLDGSLRLAQNANKAVIYFKAGEAVFAVSNQRQHRIFEMLLASGLLTKQALVGITDFTNDLVLLKALEEKQIMPSTEVDLLARRQIEIIVRQALVWTGGEWTFSPLAKIKEEMCRPIDARGILLELARALSKETTARRFRSLKECFARADRPPAHINLRPEEAFLLSRLDQTPAGVDEIRSMSAMPEADMLQALYTLWLAGFLRRENWNSAFTTERVSSILAARLELKKPAPAPAQPAAPTPEPAEPPQTPGELTLEKYLAQVEGGDTYYQVLDVPHRASADEVKQAYFRLAKRFHPDLHRQADAKTMQRLQGAFSELAHAYETLRDKEKRETYDFKLSKLLKELDRLGALENKPVVEQQKTLTEASEIFEHGCRLLDTEQHEEALAFFARALNLAPNVARYHAFYGRALAADKNQRFKAEAELQAAIKLDPPNPEYRLMLTQFFIQYNLLKRAEGELGRLLAVAPGHREAVALLDTLRNK